MSAALVLAHQGGWDEMLLVALPIVIFVVLLKVANHRAQRFSRDPSATAKRPGETGTPDEPN